MKSHLGAWKRVNIRTLWPKEAADFTPWLCEEENLALLSREVGMDLALEGREVSVGPYSADILARDTATDSYVVIENQYNKTNHDHLGKLITYASVLDASAIIWIAEEFTDEHKKALDWLNDHSSEDLSYYGVGLEIWKIDESNPAVRFNVISKPGVVKRVSAIEPVSEIKKVRLEFWTKFRNLLLERRVVSNAQTPRPQPWYDIAIGRSFVHLSNCMSVGDGILQVRLYMNHRVAGPVLELLGKEKEAIEKEIGIPLAWNPKPELLDKTIVTSLKADLGKREKWSEYLEWMVTMSAKFLAAFQPRIKKMDFSEFISTASEKEQEAADEI